MRRARRLALILAIAAPTAAVSSYLHQAWSAPRRLPAIATAEHDSARIQLEATISQIQEDLSRLLTEMNATPVLGEDLVPAPPGVEIAKAAKRVASQLGQHWPDTILLPERSWLELHRESRDVRALIAERTRESLREQHDLAERKLAIGDFEAVEGARVRVPKQPMHFIQALEGREPVQFGIFQIRFQESPELYLMRLEARLHRLELAETFVRRILRDAHAGR